MESTSGLGPSKLYRKVVDSPSLKVLKVTLDGALGYLGYRQVSLPVAAVLEPGGF